MTAARPIPALTIWQPWATLIAIGVKTIETRSWQTAYRGPIAIHAGADRRALAPDTHHPAIDAALARARYTCRQGCIAGRYEGDQSVPLGCIIAVAELYECWWTEGIVSAGMADNFGDFSARRWGWMLRGIALLPSPIPCRGRQGLWLPSADIQDRLRGVYR